jgi:hypothetical protein
MGKKSKTIRNEVRPQRVIYRFLAVFAALIAVSAPIVNYGFRIGYVFIDHETFAGFSEILFYVMVVNGIYALSVAAATLAKKRIPVPVIILSCFSAILSLLFWIFNYASSIEAGGPEIACIIIAEIIPFLAALFGVPFLLLCYPNLKISVKARNITAVVLSAVFVATLSVAAIIKAPPTVFDFSALPVVFDIGDDCYSVVFATNADAQGYVTYTPKNRTEPKTVYANSAGYKAIGKIHAVRIPRDELDENTYTAHATRVLERLSYGGKLGKTIDTKAYKLREGTNKNATNPKIISASDWHNQLSLLESAASYYKKEANLALFLGDYADYYVNEYQVIKYFLGGAHILTGGEIPGIFVRGNHEVRGNEKVEDMGLKIGLSKMYYQVERNGCMFTILDSGEDVNGDQWEHEGFYDMPPYFDEQLDWFEKLPVKPDVYNILLVHYQNFASPRGDAVYDDLAARFKRTANRKDENGNAFIALSISGDAHSWSCVEKSAVDTDGKDITNGFNFTRLIDGGTYGGGGTKTLANAKFLRNVKLNDGLRNLLKFVVLKKNPSRYRLSLISIGKDEIEFSYAAENGENDKKSFPK